MGLEAAPTLLVVEDEPSVRLLLRLILETDGYRVVAAADGTQAMRLLAAGPPPDLLLLDIHIPGADAATVLASARISGQVPALVLSGRDDAATAFPVGAVQGFISKPFDVETLLARVHGALQGVRAHRGGAVVDAGIHDVES